MSEKIRSGGGYRDTCSFQTATIMYDATWWFCEKFLDPRSRLADQMVQAARRGRLNIAEGRRASVISSQTELRLVNVARSSFDELLLDYEDFLRHRHLAQWDPESPEALAVREVPQKFKADPSNSPDRSNLTDLTDAERWKLYAPWLEHDDPAVRANALICLINQINFLLDRQIAALEKQFAEEGGYNELLAARRKEYRAAKKADPSEPTDRASWADLAEHIPDCPRCGKPMALRTAKSGKNEGKQFWGCTGYPECKGVVNL